MEDVADSTDWLSTPLSGLAPFESSLRCQICKEFYTTPMITSCSHTFCSLCIRRALSQEGKCPNCHQSDQELKLRHNWALEEVVAQFTQAREGILKFAQQAASVTESVEEVRPKKRRKLDPTPSTSNGVTGSRRSTRSQSKRTALSASQASQEQLVSEHEIANSEDEGSLYDGEGAGTPRKQPRQDSRNGKEHNDGLVECPCCTRRVKESAINAHLDRCMNGLPTSPEPSASINTNTNSNSLPFVQRTKSPVVTATKDRLPPINYALFTDASLRKKLKDLGIPNTGSKELMRKRHTEWMNLWNANCDSSRPRPKRDLLKDLDIWERTLGKQLEKTVAAGGVSGVMVKDFDRDGWAKNQKNEFDDLIRRAREKKKAVASEKQENSSEIEQDGDTPMTEMANGEQSTDNHASSSANHENMPAEPPLVNGDSDRRDDAGQLNPDGKTSVPQTPPKVEGPSLDEHAPIDLTTSASPGPLLQSDGTPRKRSRFFV